MVADGLAEAQADDVLELDEVCGYVHKRRNKVWTWNHSFKVEAVHGERFKNRSEAKSQVFEYIEVYYNRKRLHSGLGYFSPEAFETKNVA